jgi:hypothetical protein
MATCGMAQRSSILAPSWALQARQGFPARRDHLGYPAPTARFLGRLGRLDRPVSLDRLEPPALTVRCLDRPALLGLLALTVPMEPLANRGLTARPVPRVRPVLQASSKTRLQMAAYTVGWMGSGQRSSPLAASRRPPIRLNYSGVGARPQPLLARGTPCQRTTVLTNQEQSNGTSDQAASWR